MPSVRARLGGPMGQGIARSTATALKKKYDLYLSHLDWRLLLLLHLCCLDIT